MCADVCSQLRLFVEYLVCFKGLFHIVTIDVSFELTLC